MNESRTVRYRPTCLVQRWDSDHYTLLNTAGTALGQWTRTGESLKGWRKLVQDGQDATTAFSGGKQTARWTNGRMTMSFYHVSSAAVRDEHAIGCPYSISWTGMVPSQDLVAADNLAKRRMFQQIREVQTSFAGMTFLGELRQTISMIRHPAQSLFTGLGDYLRAFKNAQQRLRTNRKKLDYAAGLWLEYSFGWMPLLHDAQDAFEASQRLAEVDRTVQIRAIGIDEALLDSSTTRDVKANYVYFLVNMRKSQKLMVIYRGAVRAEPKAYLPEHMKDLFGFNLREFVPTVWELVPWSFVVDYFTNIGDILEASVTSSSGLTWLCKSTRRSVVLEYDGYVDAAYIKGLLGANFRNAGGAPGKLEIEETHVTRATSTLRAPTLQLELPGKPQKWINLAALALMHNSSLSSFNP